MRSETEMMNLILERARRDPHVRAVLLGGSRTNPEVKPDCFQDYDVTFVVDELAPFLENPGWTNCFGELMIRRMRECNRRGLPTNEGHFVYWMQFTDGIRLDLTLLTCGVVKKESSWDSLTLVLLDKDGMLPLMPEPNDGDYAVIPPDNYAFSECCNVFWWMSTEVAKGLWRWEIPYAKAAMDGPMREKLMDLLSWYMGIQTGFHKSVGKHGKFLQKHLDKPMWLSLLKTYSDAEREHIWESLLVMCELFREIGIEVAQKLGFSYPEIEDAKITEYLRQVRSLPCDAQEVIPEKKKETPLLTGPQRVSSAVLLQFSAE